ncbi:acyltransferase family protein [Maribacter dokdonensis]|uniref:acyltransferase family protein n=1 Tax=Maribacter dokdonensis TaxID=320912 RepID=UPI003D66379A
MINNKFKENEFKIDDLNLLRTFAILLVVLRHCFAPFMGIWPISVFYRYNLFADILGKYVSTISMPLFVFISGLLFSYLRNNLKKYPTYRILITKKIARLLRPYVILAPIYILIFTNFNTPTGFILNLWKGAGHLWFLLMIFTVFIIFYPLEKYFIKKPLLFFGIISLIFLLHPLVSILKIYPLAKCLQYLPFFYIGYFFHYKNVLVNKILYGKFWVLFTLHLIIFITLLAISEFMQSGVLKSLSITYINLPLSIVSVSMIYLLFTNFTFLNSIIPTSIINNLNKNSYYIYIIHQPLLLLLFKLNLLFTWSPFLVISLAFSSVILTSNYIGNILMKFHFGRKLIGAR